MCDATREVGATSISVLDRTEVGVDGFNLFLFQAGGVAGATLTRDEAVALRDALVEATA